MDFNHDELEFLKHHKILPADVLDARRLPGRVWKRRVEDEGKKFILGAPCEAKGHRLRTKAGHCIQCRPEKIAFVSRSSAPAFVYIAGSIKTKMIKVGLSSDLDRRHYKIGYESYGGASDWELLFHIKVENAGRVEFSAHVALAEHAVTKSYVKDGKRQDGKELFTCSFSTARDAVRATKPKPLSKEWVSSNSRNYNF